MPMRIAHIQKFGNIQCGKGRGEKGILSHDW